MARLIAVNFQISKLNIVDLWKHVVERFCMSEKKCDYPNCEKKVENLFANRRMLFGTMFDKIAVCKEHYDLLLFIDHARESR